MTDTGKSDQPSVEDKPQVYTVKTRKCLSCDEMGMLPEQRAFTGMETTIVYTCPDCDAKVEFKSLSQAGMTSSLGLMVLVFLTAIFAEDIEWWDLTDYLIYGLVVLLFLYVPVSTLLPYWAHPVTGEKQITESDLAFDADSFAEGFSDVMQRAIIKFEKHGFWRGFFTPIVAIAGVLAVATAIGMVNFYFF